MLTFTRIPPDNAPLGWAIEYTISSTVAQPIDVTVVDAVSGVLIGVRRIQGGKTATIDVAPFLRPAVHFAPTPVSMGLYTPTDRMRTINVSAEYLGSSASKVYAGVRTFVPTNELAPSPLRPMLLTTQPLNRLMGVNESDELTMFLVAGQELEVLSYGPFGVNKNSFSVTRSGLSVLRIEGAKYAKTDSIVVNAGALGQINYTLINQPRDAYRLAWRTGVGSLEYYTFPIERSVTIGVSKKRIYGVEGHTAAATDIERRIVICSAFERREVLEAVAEVASSSEVWLMTEQGPVAVDVTTESLLTHRRGEMSNLEIEIRLRKPNAKSWS